MPPRRRRFREYSFLERLPREATVAKRQLAFEASRGGGTKGRVGPSSLRLGMSFTDAEAAKVLGSPVGRETGEKGSVDLVWASDLSGVQGRMTSGEAKTEFEKRVSHVAGVWCCQGKQGGYSYAPYLVSPT